MKICPACDGKERKPFGSKNNFDIFRCQKCRTLYADGGGRQDESFDYTTYYDESNLEIPEFVKGRLSEIVGEFDRFRKNNRLLDIGCGAGYLLVEAKKQEWQALGTEISEPAVEDLRARGLDVYQGDPAEMNSEHNSFDVVTCTEVIEHVAEPQELANSAFKLLRDGGLFWGTTPNGAGISARLLKESWSVVSPPEHIQLFSAKGLEAIFKRAGFRKIEISALGVNPFEIYHSFRGKFKASGGMSESGDDSFKAVEKTKSPCFDRVETSYQLNSVLSQGAAKTLIKKPANVLLNAVGMGDSLKFWAIK